MRQLGFMAVDQYNQTYHIGNNPPRKWLLNYFGYQHADKMYQDPDAKHIGYIIAGLWLTIYRICAWK